MAHPIQSPSTPTITPALLPAAVQTLTSPTPEQPPEQKNRETEKAIDATLAEVRAREAHQEVDNSLTSAATLSAVSTEDRDAIFESTFQQFVAEQNPSEIQAKLAAQAQASPPAAAAASPSLSSTSNQDPEAILQQVLQQFGLNDSGVSQTSPFINQLQRSLDASNRFFEEFSQQRLRASLEKFLREQSSAGYSKYQETPPFSPFLFSRTLIQHLKNDPSLEKKLDRNALADFHLNYEKCKQKLTSFELDSYLRENSPEFEKVAKKFLISCKKTPENSQELSNWFKQWTDTEKAHLYQLFGILQQDKTKQSDSFELCRVAFPLFNKALQQRQLLDTFLDWITPFEFKLIQVVAHKFAHLPEFYPKTETEMTEWLNKNFTEQEKYTLCQLFSLIQLNAIEDSDTIKLCRPKIAKLLKELEQNSLDEAFTFAIMSPEQKALLSDPRITGLIAQFTQNPDVEQLLNQLLQK